MKDKAVIYLDDKRRIFLLLLVKEGFLKQDEITLIILI